MIDRLIDVWLEKVPLSMWLLMGVRGWASAWARVLFGLLDPE